MNKSFSDFVINPLSVHFTSPIPGERGTRGLFTTACGARSAELADTDTHKNSDASRGACAASERRQPRPTQPLPPIHSTFSILHSPSPESAGRAVYLQPPAERAARSWRTRTPIRTPMQAAERARHRNGDSQGPHNHCRPSILHSQFYIPHPRRARDARFLYNRSRSAYGAELSDANAHKNPVTSRGARSHGSATAKANTQPLPSIHFTFSISNPRIYSEQNPTLACRNRIETKSFLTCFPTS